MLINCVLITHMLDICCDIIILSCCFIIVNSVINYYNFKNHYYIGHINILIISSNSFQSFSKYVSPSFLLDFVSKYVSSFVSKYVSPSFLLDFVSKYVSSFVSKYVSPSFLFSKQISLSIFDIKSFYYSLFVSSSINNSF